MTPAQIRRTLSATIAHAVVSDALSKIPSLTDVPSTESVQSLIRDAQFTYRPNTTFGIMVDTIYAELPHETDEAAIQDTFASMCADEPSQILPTLESMSDKLAIAMAASYGVVKDRLIPAAESIVADVNHRLFEGSDLNAVPQEREFAVESFDWGALKDPAVVSECLILAQEEANIFKPEQQIRPYFVDGCFTAASRHKPKQVASEERELLKEKLHGKYPDLTDRDLVTFSGFFCSENGYNYFYNSLKPKLQTSVNVMEASGTLDRLHAMNEMLHTVISEEPTLFGDTLKENINECGKAVALMLAGVQVVRDTHFKDTAVMARTVSDGHVTSLVLNADQAVAAASEDFSTESFGVVTQMLGSHGMEFSNRGVTLDHTRKYLKADTESYNKKEAERLSRLDTQDTIDFGRVVQKALDTRVPTFMKEIGARHNPNDAQIATKRLAGIAMKGDEQVTDLITHFLADLCGNPQVTGIMTAMESIDGVDEDTRKEARANAFARYALGMITTDRYVTH